MLQSQQVRNAEGYNDQTIIIYSILVMTLGLIKYAVLQKNFIIVDLHQHKWKQDSTPLCKKPKNIAMGLLQFNIIYLFAENEHTIACPSNLIPCEEKHFFPLEGRQSTLCTQRYCRDIQAIGQRETT